MENHILRFAAVAVLAMAPSFASTIVGVELQLLIDVSGSVSTREYGLQLLGYSAAFNDPTVVGNIEKNVGGIAVQVVQWSGLTQQGIAIDWTHLTNAAETKAFADTLAAMPRLYVGGTSAVQAALLFGSTQFDDNGFEGTRISNMVGDGPCNQPAEGCGLGGQAAMAAAGVLVNALVVSGDAAVQAYYASNVVTGGGALFTASSFDNFEKSIVEKVRAETIPSAVPEPTTWAVSFAGLAALAMAVRRRNT